MARLGVKGHVLHLYNRYMVFVFMIQVAGALNQRSAQSFGRDTAVLGRTRESGQNSILSCMQFLRKNQQFSSKMIILPLLGEAK